MSAGFYSEGEKWMMEIVQRWKARALGPVVKGLDKVGVTANVLSVLGALVALAGLVMNLSGMDSWWFVGGLWMHMLMDAFDGTLARFQGTAGRKGFLVDAWSDSAVIVLASVFMYWIMDAQMILVTVYTLFYLFLNWLSFKLENLGRPYEIVLRPRIFLYLSLTIDLAVGSESVGVFLLVMSVVMGLIVAVGLWMWWDSATRLVGKKG